MRTHLYARSISFLVLIVAGMFFLPGLVHGQANIVVTTQAAPVNSLTINDIDFLNSTTPKWLFTINVRNLQPRTITATMVIRLTANLSASGSFQDAVVLRTNQFSINGNGSKTFTNLDLRDPVLKQSYVLDPLAKKKFEETALPSGSLPAGAYNFTVTVTPTTGSPATGAFSIILSNPSSIQLVFPADGDPAVNQYPLFQWQYDGVRSRISIFEKLPGQGSLEEAASGIPLIRTEVAAKSYQYPSAGVRPLQPGNTYVWYVEGLVGVAGGTGTPLKSTLRSFIVARAGVPTTTSVIDELERLLNRKYKPIFDQIRSEGLSYSGTVRLNGAPVGNADLLQILNQLRANPDAVTAVVLE